MAYAEGTTVPVTKTRDEMQRLLDKAGATHYAYGSAPERDVVQFALDGRHYRFTVERPDIAALQAAYVQSATDRGQYEWTARNAVKRIDWQARSDGEWRRRWRARLMWLKAQLEFAEVVPFEEAMLASLVLPDGRTFGSWAEPQVSLMYETGGMPPLLGDGR